MKRKLMLAASVVLACVCGCCAQDAGKVASKESSSTTPKATAQYQVELVFTGPWSFVQDSVGKRIVAVAPLIAGHSSLYLRSISGLLVPTGLYDLTLSGVQPLAATNPPPKFVPDTPPSIKAGVLTSLVGKAANDRYVINLPQTQYIQTVYSDPLAYSVPPYPVPAPALSKTYVTKVLFRYLTDSLDVRLDGTQVDVNGVASAYHQSLGSEGMIDVSIDDAPDASLCDDGAKYTFKMMNGLMQTGLYIDFPPYDVKCQKEDPQVSGGGMGAMNEYAFAAMKSAVLGGLLKLENYTKDLSKDPDFANPGRNILKRLSSIKEGVQQWPKNGPTDAQRRAFANGLSELRDFIVRREEIKAPYRNNLVNVLDDVIPFNMSGKNCKAPLMLLVNP